jgi:ABC-type nitrate/sulfonate/bicarbonate transport system permease component
MAGQIFDTQRRLYLRLCELAALCIIGFWFGCTHAQAQSSFYRPSPQEIAGRPGTLIRQEPLSLPARFSASVVRVLYRSTGLHGETIPVRA